MLLLLKVFDGGDGVKISVLFINGFAYKKVVLGAQEGLV